jgi:hypothetical protein
VLKQNYEDWMVCLFLPFSVLLCGGFWLIGWLVGFAVVIYLILSHPNITTPQWLDEHQVSPKNCEHRPVV